MRKSDEKLTSTADDVTSILAKGWAIQYADLSKTQQVFARTIFSDILFHGYMDTLTEKTVEDIHKVLRGVSTQQETLYISRTSSQYMDEYSTHSFDP